MKTFFKRLLAVSLTAALLVGCAVSGLVLPAAAEDTNLFKDAGLEGTSFVGTWTTSMNDGSPRTAITEGVGFGGSKGWEIFAGRSLSLPAPDGAISKVLDSNKYYVLSFKVSGGTVQFAPSRTDVFPHTMSVSSFNATASGTDWVEVKYEFQVAANKNFTKLVGFGFANNSTSNSVYLDDFAVYEYDASQLPDGYSVTEVEDTTPEDTTTVDITQETETVEVGSTVTLNVTKTPADATVTWTSSNDDFATVADGVVTGVAAGTVTITAAVGDVSDTCTVTVNAPSEPTPKENFFVDAGLEGDSSTWKGSWNLSGRTAVTDGVGFGGTKGWEIFAGQSRDLPAPDGAISKVLDSNKYYVLSFKVSGGTVQFAPSRTDVFPHTMSVSSFNATASGTDWVEVKYEFRVAADKNFTKLVGFSFANNSTSNSVYLDDFAVYEYDESQLPDGYSVTELETTPDVEEPEEPEVKENFFVDAGLEGKTDNAGRVWAYTGKTAVTEGVGFGGSKGWELFAGQSRDLPAGDGAISKTLATQDSNKYYVLCFKMRGGTLEFTPSRTDVYPDFLTNGSFTATTSATDWVEVKYQFQVLSGKSFNKLVGFGFANKNASGSLYFDDFAVYEYDESQLPDGYSVTEIEDTTPVKFAQPTATVIEGNTVTLTAKTYPADATITWSSLNEDIATVDQNGVVTGKAVGTATIKATTADGEATCQVTVTARTNLFVDADLEGTLTGTWEVSGTATVNATAGVGGGKAWEMYAGKQTYIPAASGTVSKNLDPTKYYVLSFKKRGGEAIFNSSNENYTNQQFTIAASGNEWVDVQFEFQLVKNRNDLSRMVGFYLKNNSTDSVYFDDFVLHEYDSSVLKDGYYVDWNFSITSAGTSVHYADEEQTIADGIRFGTKLYYTKDGTTTYGFKLGDNGQLQLAYNGEYRNVVSMGTLLKRNENTATELTLDNVGGSGANKVWQAEAYNSTGDEMKIVEYNATEGYIVFAVVMMTNKTDEASQTAFKARLYDACGYVQLEGVGTIYTSITTNSVDGYVASYAATQG